MPVADDAEEVVGTLRFSFRGVDQVFETLCQLTRNMTFQFDLVHFRQRITRCVTSAAQIDFDGRVLRVGGVRVPHITNRRGLKVAHVQVYPSQVEYVPRLRHDCCPIPDCSPRFLKFKVHYEDVIALILASGRDCLDDYELASPYQPCELGFPVLGLGTLRLVFNNNLCHIYEFRCAVLMDNFDEWRLPLAYFTASSDPSCRCIGLIDIPVDVRPDANARTEDFSVRAECISPGRFRHMRHYELHVMR